MEQEMTPAAHRKLRVEALEYALRAKGPDDDADGIVKNARLFGAFLCGKEADRDVLAEAAATELRPSIDRDAQIQAAAMRLINRSYETGNWGDLPRQLKGLQRELMGTS